MDSKSELEIGGKPGTLADVKVGSYAHGKMHKTSDGKEVVASAKFDKDAPERHKDKDKDKDKDKPAGKSKA